MSGLRIRISVDLAPEEDQVAILRASYRDAPPPDAAILREEIRRLAAHASLESASLALLQLGRPSVLQISLGDEIIARRQER